MNIKRKVLSRAGSLAAAVAVALGALVPAIVPMVSAAAQVQTRSIQMSDATPGHTNTTYKVSFTPATATAGSMVIDFCSNSSIIGGLCNAPGGLDAKTSVGLTNGTGTNGWVVETGASFAANNTVAIKNSTGSALSTLPIDFELTGITNPTGTAGTFWARVYTYTGGTYGGGGTTGYADPQNLGSAMLDYGGFALSTTNLINITATVMETLTFCTSKSAPGTGCSGTDAPNLVLGQGTPQVLGTTTASTDTAYFQISTNALTGAVVNMKSHNLTGSGCSGLSRDGGTTCNIPGVGSTPNDFTTDNVAEFGLNVGAGAAVGSGSGTVTPTAPYSTASNFGMDNTAVIATYGSKIADTALAACQDMNTLLTFAAQASPTTPAGVYSVNESLIATGTF